MDKAGYGKVAEATEGYSFAYLKELYLSAMMKWIAHPGKVPISALMTEQCEALRAQMATDPGDAPVPQNNRYAAHRRAMAQQMRRWKP